MLVPLEMSLFLRDSARHLIRGTLGPCERAPQMSSQSVQTFLQGSVVSNRQTHRQCHTTTSVLSVWANSSEILLVLYSAFHNSHDHFSVVSSFVCV